LGAVIDSLSNHFKCVVLDQRGTGKSILNQVDSTALTMTNYVNDIEALRKHLRLEQIQVIGHSWGGMLAMEYASRRPNNVKNLILMNPGGPTGNFFTYYGDNIYMRLHEEDIKEMEMLSSSGKSSFSAIFPGYFFNREKALKAKNEIDFDSWFGQPGGITGITFSNYTSSQSQRVNQLKKYKGKVNIILGRQDPIGASTVFEIRDILSQSEIHFIEKCGHFPWLENETQVKNFYSLLYGFLE
jgi:proline iminopeptidase